MYKQLILIALILTSTFAQQCSVSDADKVDCGYYGINQSQCQAKGCCWASASSSSIPWCFYQSSSNPCGSLNFSASGPGFTQNDFNTMYSYFMSNVNIGGKGGIVASPDTTTPGGSYYYHWSRDGALTMRAFQELNDFDLTKIDANMQSYVNWVLKVHSLSDPNNVDIRVEVKYELPDATPYAGGWCRPQNDGPALRAITLILYAQNLIKNGKTDYVKQYLWTGNNNYFGGAIKYDLDYVPSGHTTQTCDLWEEIRSYDLFWNKYTARYAMILGAEFATQMGDSASAASYKQAAQDIENSLLTNHWNGNFIQEDSNRQKDSAVIVAFNDGYAGDSFLAPSDVKIAKTVKAYNTQFCGQFSINQVDNNNKIPGVMYGRYQGDTYAGGNPWILSTGALANVFYKVAELIQQKGSAFSFTTEELAAWKDVLNAIPANPTNDQLKTAFLNAGDSVLQRLYYHVKGDNFHLAEQIDRNTGAQASATDLTWSYAEVLQALHRRNKITGQTVSDIKEMTAQFLAK